MQQPCSANAGHAGKNDGTTQPKQDQDLPDWQAARDTFQKSVLNGEAGHGGDHPAAADQIRPGVCLDMCGHRSGGWLFEGLGSTLPTILIQSKTGRTKGPLLRHFIPNWTNYL